MTLERRGRRPTMQLAPGGSISCSRQSSERGREHDPGARAPHRRGRRLPSARPGSSPAASHATSSARAPTCRRRGGSGPATHEQRGRVEMSARRPSPADREAEGPSARTHAALVRGQADDDRRRRARSSSAATSIGSVRSDAGHRRLHPRRSVTTSSRARRDQERGPSTRAPRDSKVGRERLGAVAQATPSSGTPRSPRPSSRTGAPRRPRRAAPHGAGRLEDGAVLDVRPDRDGRVEADHDTSPRRQQRRAAEPRRATSEPISAAVGRLPVRCVSAAPYPA